MVLMPLGVANDSPLRLVSPRILEEPQKIPLPPSRIQRSQVEDLLDPIAHEDVLNLPSQEQPLDKMPGLRSIQGLRRHRLEALEPLIGACVVPDVDVTPRLMALVGRESSSPGLTQITDVDRNGPGKSTAHILKGGDEERDRLVGPRRIDPLLNPSRSLAREALSALEPSAIGPTDRSRRLAEAARFPRAIATPHMENADAPSPLQPNTGRTLSNRSRSRLNPPLRARRAHLDGVDRAQLGVGGRTSAREDQTHPDNQKTT